MKKFLLIDGSNVMFRAYFATAAMNENLMRNHKGFPTNMVYGFINIYTKIINNGYTHVAVAFDKGKKTRRHLMFEDYKAGRQKTPQELLDQIPYLHKFLDAMNIKHFWSFDYEADDIVASLSKKFYSDFDEIDVLSNDNDLFQLIRPKVFQVYTEKKEQVLFDEEMLMEKKGVTFEEALQKLEGIVKTLEGEVTLEDAIKLFEEGIEVSKVCVEELKAEKGKLSLLTDEINNLTEELNINNE